MFNCWPRSDNPLSKVVLLLLMVSFSSVNAQQKKKYSKEEIQTIRQMDEIEFNNEKNDLVEMVSDYEHIYRIASILKKDSVLLSQLPSVFPLIQNSYKKLTISSTYGYRWHPVSGHKKFHNGIDIPQKKGTPIYATATGIIEFTGYSKDHLGVFIKIRHRYGFETIYGHLSAYNVIPGEVVRQGQMIGRVGSTGLSTGNHLHYIIKKNGKEVNPYRYCYLKLDLFNEEKPKVVNQADQSK